MDLHWQKFSPARDPRETRPLLCDWVHDACAALPASLGTPSFGARP
jgi:hypothetical protein